MPSVTHIFNIILVHQVPDAVSKKLELFFDKYGVKVSGQYCRDILLSLQTLAAIKHIGDNNFDFQYRAAHHRIGRAPHSNVLQRKTLNFVCFQLWLRTAQSCTPMIRRFLESCNSTSLYRTLKKSSNSRSLSAGKPRELKCNFRVSVFCEAVLKHQSS